MHELLRRDGLSAGYSLDIPRERPGRLGRPLRICATPQRSTYSVTASQSIACSRPRRADTNVADANRVAPVWLKGSRSRRHDRRTTGRPSTTRQDATADHSDGRMAIMSGYATGIGMLLRREPETARALLVRALESSEGNVSSAARKVGVSRRHIYRVLEHVGLWRQVTEAREQKLQRMCLNAQQINQARRVLASSCADPIMGEHGARECRVTADRSDMAHRDLMTSTPVRALPERHYSRRIPKGPPKESQCSNAQRVALREKRRAYAARARAAKARTVGVGDWGRAHPSFTRGVWAMWLPPLLLIGAPPPGGARGGWRAATSVRHQAVALRGPRRRARRLAIRVRHRARRDRGPPGGARGTTRSA